MSIETILDELKSEHDRINHVIEVLEGGEQPHTNLGEAQRGAPALRITAFKKPGVRLSDHNRRGGLTPEGRAALSAAMKKRWRARRKLAKQAS